ncbi:hypothetical protein BP5796_05408 [Coleophoma crateriformis]|uniref:Isomerase YbhE n=1 Tax=Coleophoma crateriformis TaxID=565419 RepID=A0A3D8S3G7_9HELO|nr:hypothetical protein BP5796_05408 [Coleophoma crateriformis]
MALDSLQVVLLLPQLLHSLCQSSSSWLAMRLHLSLGGLVTTAVATNLYVSSYIGTITTLQLSQAQNGSYALKQVAINNGSAPNPSWLTLDSTNGVLYCADEGLYVPDGSISSYSTSPSGQLKQIDRHTVISGPVHSVVYNDGKAQAFAHYTGSSVTTFSILASGGLQSLQNFTYTMSSPGPNPSRQEAPHPHEALLDPTGSFVLVNDLGADLVRVYSIDKKTSELIESTPFHAPPGSGPRHGSFLVSGNQTFYFLISELGNTIASYKLSYGNASLEFTQVFRSGTYGNHTVPTGAAAAECLVSPDHKFLLTSSRNDSLFHIDNFDANNSTKIPSDTLQTWEINPYTGELAFKQLSPAGGLFPRQFSVNKLGDLVAVGLQNSGRVVIVQRDIKTGTYGKFVAEIDIPGQVTSVVWDE